MPLTNEGSVKPLRSSRPTVTVMGLGYVGLTTGLCFADRGINVLAFDIDEAKVATINKGNAPFYELGVSDLLRTHLGKTFNITSHFELSDIIFITIGTPSKKDGAIDLSYVISACEIIGRKLSESKGYHLVVVKSSVVPGTTEGVVKTSIEKESRKRIGQEIGLAFNPEFLKEGSAIKDTFEPDRLVIGEHDKNSGDMLSRFYEDFYQNKMPPLVRTNLVNAEFIKYASNAFLATKISYINTIANIAQKIEGADIEIIAKGIGLDKRIGEKFLKAGVGFGGSCFPKDLSALIAFSKSLEYDPLMLEAVSDANAQQPLIAVQLAESFLGDLKGKTATVLGLAFKPETDDIREAVSLRIISELLRKEAFVKAYDPIASENVFKIFQDRIDYAKSALDALKEADCCIVATEWAEFKKLEPLDFISNMRTPVVIDGRRVFDPLKFRPKLRFAAIGLGTGSIKLEDQSGQKE